MTSVSIVAPYGNRAGSTHVIRQGIWEMEREGGITPHTFHAHPPSATNNSIFYSKIVTTLIAETLYVQNGFK